MARTSTDNPCPQDVLIKALASKLDVTLEVASFIYNTYYVTCLELLKDYDKVNVTPFIFLERKLSPKKEFYNVNTKEMEWTVPKDKLYARVTPSCKDFNDACRHITTYEENLRKQEIYNAQKQHELEQLQKEQEEQKRKEKERRRRAKRKLSQKERLRRKAIERLIEDEMFYYTENRQQYEKELRRRLKG